jgi:transposase-like protein
MCCFNPVRPASASTSHKSRYVKATSNGLTAVGIKFLPPSHSAQATIAGIETAHMIRKGQLSEENMPAYKQFMALAG